MPNFEIAQTEMALPTNSQPPQAGFENDTAAVFDRQAKSTSLFDEMTSNFVHNVQENICKQDKTNRSGYMERLRADVDSRLSEGHKAVIERDKNGQIAALHFPAGTLITGKDVHLKKDCKD